jgi:hypothetical protein
MAYQASGSCPLAIPDYETAYSLDQRSSPAYNGHGECREQGLDFKNALKDYEKAVQIEPENAVAVANRDRLKAALAPKPKPTPTPKVVPTPKPKPVPTPKSRPVTVKPKPGLYRVPGSAVTFELSAITPNSMRVRQWQTETPEPPASGGSYYNSGTASLLSDGVTWRTKNRDVEGYCCGNNVELEFQFLSPTSFKGVRWRLWPLGSPSPGANDFWQAHPPDEIRLVGTAPVVIQTPQPTPTPAPKQAPIKTPAGKETQVLNNGNIYGVGNGPTSETRFVVNGPWVLTYVQTYHWNNARGAAPGAIGVYNDSGQRFGGWRASGSPGQGGVPNAYWEVRPNVVLPAGTYTIVVSSPETWSHNSQSGGCGFAVVKGYPYGGGATDTPPVKNTPTTPTQGESLIAIIENRSNMPTHIFAQGDTFGPSNKIAPGEKRNVTVTMDTSGRVKFTAGRNGQVITTKIWNGVAGDLNRYPRVIFDGSQLLITTGLR